MNKKMESVMNAAKLITDINTKLDNIQKCLDKLLQQKSSNGSETTSE